RKVETVRLSWVALDAVDAPGAGRLEGLSRGDTVIRVSVGAAGAAVTTGANLIVLGSPAGITPLGDVPADALGATLGGGGAGGKLAAGGMAAGAGMGADGAMAAAWLAEVSFCSNSAKRCIVFASKACRSLLRRVCSSRSFSYWASLRPAVPTHWSTGLTCWPGGITPMLVTALGWPLPGLGSVGL